MDNIRITIQLLFQYRRSESILSSLQASHSIRQMDVFLDKNWFQRTFREVQNIYSLDQIGTIGEILESKWTRKVSDNNVVSIAEKSVFNVLLHFSKDVLIERDKAPVCRYENLLRWHDLSAKVGEDMLTTSFLAAKDLSTNYNRNQFTWNPIINHNNEAINYLLQKRKAELHFHLKGSSLNFDLNWLSLMNSISGRKTEFASLNHYQSPKLQINEDEPDISLYLSTIKACAIRYLLFLVLENSLSTEEELTLKPLLQCKTMTEIQIHLPTLESKLRSIRMLRGKNYGKNIVDYAIKENLTAQENEDPHLYLLSILSGERRLLYRMFKRIYQLGRSTERFSTLFYAYLVTKTQIRNELVQLNEKIGFGNFAHYESRKELFIKEGSVYEPLIVNMAIRGFLKDKKAADHENYLEARITPKTSATLLSGTISKTDKDVLDKRFTINKLKLTELPNFYYILHFIKKEDKSKKGMLGFICRQHKLRKEVKSQAIAIQNLRTSINKAASRIVGIDAANSEILCRPEIFAQAYRYLKYRPIKNIFDHIKANAVSKLGFTYHVGEDYMDIVDGLRAVDESLLFLNLSHGDRLGHALVLGTDPHNYYTTENKTLVMPQQIFLDNVVWLYVKIQIYKLKDCYPLFFQLENWFESYFRQIFSRDNQPLPSIQTYYQSWLLRGDNPACYSYDGTFNTNDINPWEKYALNFWEPVKQARQNKEACKLYYRYHYDSQVKEKGRINDQYLVDNLYISTVIQVQQAMLKGIENKHICIETNPTSNFRIGTFDKYATHPITKFYNQGLNTDYPDSYIPVSINTDDQGIFCTSIEREFSLLAIALEKKFKNSTDIKNAPRVIYNWLNDIREMAFEQRFKNNL